MRKIALIQMASFPEDLAYNESVIFDYLKEGLAKGVEFFCFPEMAMTGYSNDRIKERYLEQKAMIERIHDFAKEHKVTILVGGIEKSEMDTKSGENYHISQYVIDEEIRTYRKTHVGQKEQQVFVNGEEVKVFESRGFTFGIMICYDGHFPELVTIMSKMGAQMVFNPSASPNNPAKRLTMWQKYLVARSYDNRVWIGATNLRFNGKGGGMMAVDSNGDLVKQCGLNSDQMMTIEYQEKVYSLKSMRRRDFNGDRRQALYDRYL